MGDGFSVLSLKHMLSTHPLFADGRIIGVRNCPLELNSFRRVQHSAERCIFMRQPHAMLPILCGMCQLCVGGYDVAMDGDVCETLRSLLGRKWSQNLPHMIMRLL